MSGQVNHDSPIPYYVQVKDILKDRVSRGDWPVGGQIPSEPELCQLYDVSRTVVRQALQALMLEGLIIRRKGRGTYVAEPKISENLAQHLTGFYDDMRSQGYIPISRVLRQELVEANAKVAAYLEIPASAKVIEITRLRLVQDEPLVLVTTYLPHALCPDVLHTDLTQQSLYAYLRSHCSVNIARGRRILEAVTANEYEATLLNIKKGTPLIMFDSISYSDDGTPVEYYHALHRSDRLRFEVELVRVLKGDGIADLTESNL